MKLITKTTLLYILISIIVFGIGGVVTYNLISKEIAKETDYYLRSSLDVIDYRLKRAVQRGYDLERRFNTSQLNIQEVEDGEVDEIYFSDTIAMHPHLKQLENMRMLKVVRDVEGKLFEITMIDVVVEDSDIYDSVVQIITRLFALLVLASIIGSFFISKTLLRPFHATLSKIKSFRVDRPERINLPSTRVKEFSQLNTFINEMTGKAQDEYQSLKKFSENASHEMQTPLAIAQGKLEILADNEQLSEAQFSQVMSAQKALGRLSQLHQSLSLLTKIENREFDQGVSTDVSQLVRETMENFKELYAMKNLTLTAQIEDAVVVNLNPHLGSILLSNLFHNAMRHNQENGFVKVNLTSNNLTIRNSGEPPNKDPALLFNRFEKSSEQTNSSGLGLAIVKEICDFHSMKISYMYDEHHQIDISFA
ncbi:MAG: HAMP domain-containing histidine kinase [Saprospiraceae bacterium]|nr:HAMP domain-containing histidine kinase [Saprospiraceae bacterium]